MTIEIEHDVLCKVFDTAVNSMDFGSGFLDDETVAALRECAIVLGVDPMVATPDNFKCKYGQPHEWSTFYYRGEFMCLYCRTPKPSDDAT